MDETTHGLLESLKIAVSKSAEANPTFTIVCVLIAIVAITALDSNAFTFGCANTAFRNLAAISPATGRRSW
jgi:hypothetical protein